LATNSLIHAELSQALGKTPALKEWQ
jgi:hypothetical protein